MNRMASDKVLSKLLSYDNSQLPHSNFDPLLTSENAEKVAKSLCKILTLTNNDNSSQLKVKLRRSVVELTQNLCNVKHSNNALKESEKSRINIIIKHIGRSKKNASNRRHRRKEQIEELYDKLNLYGVQNFNFTKTLASDGELSVKHLNIGLALINITSQTSRDALRGMVVSCLNLPGNYDDKTYEFLEKVWSHSQAILPVEIYDRLSERMVSLLETKLLDMIRELIQYKDESEFYDKIESLIEIHFPNKNVLFSRMANSPHMFTNTFLILNDILIKTKFEPNIQNLIRHILQDVQCRNMEDNLVNLYPYELRNVVFYLDCGPDVLLLNAPVLYAHVTKLMDELCENNKFEFVLLLSHYELWFSHCTDKIK